MSTDSVAQDQIKAYVDRILRMKEERKAIDADIREIYAEAKGNGFDKTVLGKLVNYVEKRSADANAVMEGESLFDLYLTAYDSASGKVGTAHATHTHEKKFQSSPKAGQAREDAASSCGDAGDQLVHSSVENEAAEISTPILPVQDAKAMTVDTATAVTPEPEQEVQIFRPGPDAGSSNGRTTAFDADNAGSIPAPAPTLSFADKIKKLRPLCQSPDRCRSSGGKAHCNTCLKSAGQSLVSA